MNNANKLFLVLIWTLLWGCNDINDNSEISNSKPITKVDATKLNFIGHWRDEGYKYKLVKEFVNEFEFKNQNIKVNLTFDNELFDRHKNQEEPFLLNQLNKPVPDWDIIFFTDIHNFVNYTNDPDWMKKNLVDFSEIPEFTKNIKPEFLTKKFKSEFGNILPGILITQFTWSLWCNTSVAKKVGIEVKQFNMTFDDFLGYLKAVDDYNKAHGDHIYGIFELENSYSIGFIGLILYLSEVGNLDEVMDGKFSLKKLEAYEKTLKEIDKMSAYKPFPSNLKNVPWDAVNDYILTDRCLFNFNASWMYNIWQKKDEKKTNSSISPMEPPSFKPNIAVLGGTCYCSF